MVSTAVVGTLLDGVRGAMRPLRAAAALLALRTGGLAWLAPVLLALVATAGIAKDAPPSVADPVLEKQMLAISAELRCLVCQNQTIADSDAGLAVDLRNQVRTMLREGKSEKQILEFMTQRYGDFVLYRPPVNPATALLWFGPPALLVVGALTLWLVLRKRSRMSPDEFEPDEADTLVAAGPGPDTGPVAATGSQKSKNT